MDALEALALLKRELNRDLIDDVPDDWKTVLRWADSWGMKRAQTLAILSAGVASNRVEQREFRIQTGAGVRRVPHYRVKT